MSSDYGNSITAGSPVNFKEIMDLLAPPFSVPPQLVRRGVCCVESDRYISVLDNSRDRDRDRSRVLVVDSLKGSLMDSIHVQSASSEQAKMNPVAPLIAVKGESLIQVYDLLTRSRVKSHNFGQPIVHWGWIGEQELAVVTPYAVHHWNSWDNSAPRQIFQRISAINGENGVSVSNYQLSDDGNWCLLTCQSDSPSGLYYTGILQLYSMRNRASQLIKGCIGEFTTIYQSKATPSKYYSTGKGRTSRQPLQMLCFLKKKINDPYYKLSIAELSGSGESHERGGNYSSVVASLPIAADIQNDEVIGLKISREHGVGYVLSKYGNIFIFDVLSKKGIFFSRMDVDEVFATVMDSLTEGIMFVARTGLVYTVSLNPAECSNYVVARMNDRELANDLWKRLGRTVTTDEELPRAGTGHENRSSNLSEEEVLAINTARNSGKDNPSKRNSKERDSKEMSEQIDRQYSRSRSGNRGSGDLSRYLEVETSVLSQDPKDRAPLNRSSSESLSPNMQNVTSAAKPFSDKSGKDLNNRTSEESPRHPVYGSSPTSALSSYSCPDNFSRSHSDSYQPPRTGTQRGQYDWSITLKENSNFLQEDSLPTSGKSVGSAGRNLPPQHKSTSKKGDSAAETIGIDYSDFERRTGKSMVDSHDDSSNGDESRFYHVRTPSKDALLTASRPSSIAMRTEETTAETVDTLTQQTSEIRQSWDLNTLEGLRAKLMAVQKESVQVQKSQCELISNLQKQLAALHNHYEEMMAQSNSEAWRVIDQQKETIAHLEEKIACFQVQEKQYEDHYLCVVCLERPRSVLYVDCQHCCVCQICDSSLQKQQHKVLEALQASNSNYSIDPAAGASNSRFAATGSSGVVASESHSRSNTDLESSTDRSEDKATCPICNTPITKRMTVKFP